MLSYKLNIPTQYFLNILYGFEETRNTTDNEGKSLDLISNLFEHQRRNAIARACGKRVRHLPVRNHLKTM